MDDKFLYGLQETPDARFTNELQRRLKENETERVPMGWRRVVWAGAITVAIVLALAFTSPGRALVETLLTTIAGQSFDITDDYPGDNTTGEETIIEPEIMSLDEALEVFPYDVTIPEDIPSGYIQQDDVRVYVGEGAEPFANSIEIVWFNAGEKMGFSLRVSDDSEKGEIIGPDSVEEVFLKDNVPAALIRGGWNYDTKSWDDEAALRLKWSMDGLTYVLSGRDVEFLMEIASSMLE